MTGRTQEKDLIALQDAFEQTSKSQEKVIREGMNISTAVLQECKQAQVHLQRSVLQYTKVTARWPSIPIGMRTGLQVSPRSGMISRQRSRNDSIGPGRKGQETTSAQLPTNVAQWYPMLKQNELSVRPVVEISFDCRILI